MNEKKGGAPLPVAAGISVAIIAGMIILNIVPQKAFGITTGWMAILMLSLYMAIAIPKGISKDTLIECLGGCAYGIFAGAVYAVFVPCFFVCVFALLFCKLSNKLTYIMNDYALTVLTVYTIAGVANIPTIWMNILMYLVGAVIVTVITVVAGKAKNK